MWKHSSGKQETLRIPEGTQNGEIFKIKNAGMPNLHGRKRRSICRNKDTNTNKNITKRKIPIRRIKKELKNQ